MQGCFQPFDKRKPQHERFGACRRRFMQQMALGKRYLRFGGNPLYSPTVERNGSDGVHPVYKIVRHASSIAYQDPSNNLESSWRWIFCRLDEESQSCCRSQKDDC